MDLRVDVSSWRNAKILNSWQDAQTSVIGALLIDSGCTGEIMQRARPEQFGNQTLRHVFEVARDLWLDNKPVDIVTLLAALGEDYRATLADCMKLTPTVAYFSAYLDILRDAAKLNALQNAATEISLAGSLAEAESAWERIGEQLQESEDVEDLSWGELVSDYLDRMSDKTPPRYLSWGIEQLDRIIQVSRGKFVVLGADSSVGKTALALQFAYHMASTGIRVGFFSLETDKESLTDRLMAETQVAGINLPKTKAKALSSEDVRKATEAGIRSENVPLRIIRKANTIEQIRARTLQRRFQVIFIDYLQLIDAPGRERWEIVTQISMRLHRMAQQLGVTIVGLSQLTPPDKTQKRAPSKDDLRESRQLKHDADVILLMSLGTDGEKEWRELQVAKNKDGRLGRMRLLFDPEHMSFRYLETPQANPLKDAGKKVKSALKAEAWAAGQAEQGSIWTELPDGEGGEIPF